VELENLLIDNNRTTTTTATSTTTTKDQQISKNVLIFFTGDLIALLRLVLIIG